MVTSSGMLDHLRWGQVWIFSTHMDCLIHRRLSVTSGKGIIFALELESKLPSSAFLKADPLKATPSPGGRGEGAAQ